MNRTLWAVELWSLGGSRFIRRLSVHHWYWCARRKAKEQTGPNYGVWVVTPTTMGPPEDKGRRQVIWSVIVLSIAFIVILLLAPTK